MRKIAYTCFCIAVLAFLVLPLSACNTVDGIGRDMKSAGEAVSGSAKH